MLPTLSGRLLEWLPNETEDTGKNALLGICRRGWVQNQLRYRAAAEVVTILRQAGLEPVAIFGSVAWAMLYAEEKALRPIRTLDILIRRGVAAQAARALQAAGWFPEPGMPVPEGPVLDRFAGIWFRSPSGVSLQLAWRLWSVSPELAPARTEAVPLRQPVDIQGVKTFVLPTEELLLEALTREPDQPVSWKCDARLYFSETGLSIGIACERCHTISSRVRPFYREIRGEGLPHPFRPVFLDYRRPGRLPASSLRHLGGLPPGIPGSRKSTGATRLCRLLL